jgi:hypothetical protein
MSGNARSYLRPGAVERIFGRILVSLIRIGLVRGHFYVLEVRGRQSGRTISLPVDPIDLDGRCYLVCARGNANWVRNARAAGEVALVRAMRRRRYAVRELPPGRRPPVLKTYLARTRYSASSRYRRGRRRKHSPISPRVIRSSSCNPWTRPQAALSDLAIRARHDFGLRFC